MYADALLAIVVFGLLLWFFYGPWQTVCTDWARQRIFESRDAIFDLASVGKLAFDTEDYRTIRSSLELSIRFAHELTLFRFAVLSSRIKQRNVSELSQAVDRITDKETRERVRSLVDNALAAAVLMMGYKSIFLLPVIGISTLIAPIRKWILPHAKAMEESVQVEAERACA